MKTRKGLILFLLTTTPGLAAQSPPPAALMLTDSEQSNRLAAVHQIIDLTGPRSPFATELERLLLQATADPDAEISALATRALGVFENPAEPELGSDQEVRARADARRLAWVEEVFSRPYGTDQDAVDRLAAMQTLVHLASGNRLWIPDLRGPDLRWLVERARQDTNLEIARLGEKVLARHEGRPIEPDFIRPAVRSQERRATPLESDLRANANYISTGDPNPDIRLASLHWVMDIALSEGVESDPRILNSLLANLADPDPRIRHFVRLSLATLSGDENRAHATVEN